jgi:hypothetical protein
VITVAAHPGGWRFFMLATIAAVQADGLTLGRILGDIPHDGPAIVIYVMLVVFAGLIWRGSRRRAS